MENTHEAYLDNQVPKRSLLLGCSDMEIIAMLGLRQDTCVPNRDVIQLSSA